jgi:hypothetical protein
VNDHSAGVVFRACMVVLLLGALAPASGAQAQTLTTLYSFCAESACLDGELPTGSLVQAPNGNLYGTNGTAASFSVISASAIQATVPAGATTGVVQVVTPGGVLSSNAIFRVNP